MSDLANYRFLPWARRGLVAEIPTPDPVTAPLPAGRGALRVKVSINNGPLVSAPDIATCGPGDVIGIDPRVMVRTEPRSFTPDFEPNYLAAIDFDAPDFPWMLTPAAPQVANGAHKLRPWLVLLVVDRALVELPKFQRGRPLPTITIEAAVAATELPNLDESWAWAHAQVSVASTFAGNLPDHLASMPDLNVSRLVSPRRLVPMHQYCACLVPAFDQGVIAGMGGQPDPAQPLKPAWSAANPAKTELPVYFHWEFSTGPAGDFEELARRLKPILPPKNIGFQKVYLNPTELELAGIGAERADAYAWVEGALLAPTNGGPVPKAGEPGAPFETVPQAIRDKLKDRVNEPAVIAAGLPVGAAHPIGPPIYGSWPANQHSITPTTTGWLRNLNLDPRGRVAAGLGAEIVRQNQEDFMQACWEQVDEVLKANDLLNRSRLAQEAANRLYARFFQTRPADQLLAMTHTMHQRIRFLSTTLDMAIRRSSLPDSVFDSSFRRLVSPQRPAIKRAMRRAGLGNAPAPRFVPSFNADHPDVDPTRFVPDGLTGSRALGRVGGNPDAGLDFKTVGLTVKLDAPSAQALVRSAQGAAAVMQRALEPWVLNATVEQSGVVLEQHFQEALELADHGLERSQPLAVGDLLSSLRNASVSNPTATALMMSVETGGRATISPIFIEPDGGIMVERAGQPRSLIGKLDPTVRPGVTDPGVLVASINDRVRLAELGGIRDIAVVRPLPTRVGVVDRNVVLREPALTNTTLPPIRQREVVDRYRLAFTEYRNEYGVATAPPQTKFVPVTLEDLRKTLLTRTNPLTTIPARTRTMISVNGKNLAGADPSRVMVSATADRVMVGPVIRDPMYNYLAAYDGERFLPGLGLIPQNAVVLLVTNPRFVEGFLVGMSHEMSRELLWRTYPTDQRGTVFQRFWDWSDGGDDIKPIHTWPKSQPLGGNARQLPGGSQIVMLVRGELLRRYPGTVVLAWQGEQRDGQLRLKANPAAGDVLTPVFSGRFAPDFTFFGFSLTPADIRNGSWFLVLQEQPVEPRFGFDTPESDRSPGLASWLDATWADVATAEGSHLRIAGNPVTGQTLGGVTFGRDAAHLAAVLLQRPFRAAIDAKKLMAKME